MRYLNHNLTFSQGEPPTPKRDEVLIRVHAAGVNRADLLQSKGKYPPPEGASSILGLEVAGTIEKIGSNDLPYMVGDRVMCLLAGGGYAEYVTVNASHIMPIPHNLDFCQAASIPEVFLTAYQALFFIGELQPNQNLLIHAAGSGVGTAALQLARQIDAHVICTTRTQSKLEKLLELGSYSVMNPESGSFAKKVLASTDGHGADLILDFVGAPYFSDNMTCLAKGGCIVYIATMGGKELSSFDIRHLMQKWATITGTTLRTRSPEYKTRLVREFSKFAISRLESKAILPVIDQIIPWENAKEAHTLLEKNQNFGKIVLSIYTAKT